MHLLVFHLLVFHLEVYQDLLELNQILGLKNPHN